MVQPTRTDQRILESRRHRVLLELLKAKLDEREKLHGDYFRTTSIALLVLGACLKFFIDEKLDTRFRWMLPIAGLLFTIIALVAIKLGEKARRATELEIVSLMNALGGTFTVGQSLRLKYALSCFAASCVVFLLGFLYVLIRFWIDKPIQL